MTNKLISTSPEVSLIVPVYNTSDYLEECLDSIRAQSFSDFEVFLINDGSTDISADICRKYVERDSRFYLLEQENAGVSAARNLGLDNANGRLVAFIDSDDAVHPDYLRLLHDAMDDEVSIAQCSFTRVDSIPQSSNTEVKCTVICHNGLNDYILSNHLSAIVCDKLFRIELFNSPGLSIRFPVAKTMEDAYILTDIYAIRKPSVKVIDCPLYYYRVRLGSIMNRKFSIRFMECSFEQYKHRIEHTKDIPELYAVACRQLGADFLHYYQLIYQGRVAGVNGDRRECYRALSRWQKEHISLIASRKMRVLLRILNIMPWLARFLK